MSKESGYKYRIKIEAISECGDVEQVYSDEPDGIACDGFMILANRKNGCLELIHDLSLMKIATMMAHSKNCMEAASLARILKDIGDSLKDMDKQEDDDEQDG